MDYFSKADRVIGSLVNGEGKTQFIIYPLGERGMLVKRILNKIYGIEEKYIVDNGKAAISNKKIITNTYEVSTLAKTLLNETFLGKFITKQSQFFLLSPFFFVNISTR